MTQNEDRGVILLLEDDDLDAELVCAALQTGGIALEVERAANESRYHDLLNTQAVSLILSDFSLPAYDGMAALSAAQQLAPHVPFIFVSGAIGEERAIETMRRGATDYVLKSRLERLVPAVRRALAEAETTRLRVKAERERDRLLILERQAREAAETANQMKDDFLALVSHELRTPLNAIVGWVSLLMSGKLDEAKLARGLATIQRNAKVQARIIEDILDISRIISGKLALQMANTPVTTFLTAAVDAVRPIAAAKEVRLDIECAADLPNVIGDGERLQQVVWNLVTNAVKFTPAGGHVRVQAKARHEAVEIVVEDTGCGIDAALLPHVFERFRQADSSKTREHGGLGLGLAIAKHIAEMHGGSVSASSAGLGQGACFAIKLPAARPPDTPLHLAQLGAAADQSISVPRDLHGIRVLVVDDECDAREILREILTTCGAVVITAGSAEAALTEAVRFRPHVLVSDIGMPQHDGYSLLRSLRATHDPELSRLPALALTAYSRDVDRTEAERAGYQTHLAKPVAPDELIAAVGKLAQRAVKLDAVGG